VKAGDDMALFDRFRKKANEDESLIYAFSFSVAGDPIPAPMTGAEVFVYVVGDSQLAAADAAVKALRDDGYTITEMHQTAHEIPVSAWDSHITKVWQDYPGHFPNQSSVLDNLRSKGAVFSPFAGFER
jgi:hypothetical protein